MMKAIVADRPSSSGLTAVFDEFFAQVKVGVDGWATGPEASNQLLRLMCSHFDHGDGTTPFQRLHTFGVANGINFSEYFRTFRVVVSSVTGLENTLALTASTVLELVRRSVMNQYPGVMPAFYPGASATALTLFVSNDVMWLSLETMATNRTPDKIGENMFSLPPLAGLSLEPHAGNRSQSRSAATLSRSGPVGSSHNPVMTRVADADHNGYDPFSHNYNHCPTEPSDWEPVF